MHRSALVTLIIIFFTFSNRLSKSQTLSEAETTTELSNNGAYIDMEIINIEVLPRVGNTVVLSWGKPLKEYDLDWTYGVYYGPNVDEALREPKLTTKELFLEVGNLSFCTQYVFAVGVVKPNNPTVHPARNVRSIGTLVDPLTPPVDLQVEFIPDEQPCLLIKWSASCPNIGLPLGYLVTVHEADSPRVILISHPRSFARDLATTLRVTYGGSYSVKVATDVINSQPTSIVSYKVPYFLQPYRVRLTSRTDGGFVMYWREPYVPYYVGDYYYEVYVYPGRELSDKPMIYATNRPVFQFQGNQSEYTFMVGLRSDDGHFSSLFTEPIAQNILGENQTLTIN